MKHFLSALLGGLVVACTFFFLDVGEKRTTVIRQAPLDSKAPASPSGLTPTEIYKRDAPGVVFISASGTSGQSPFGIPSEPEAQAATGSGFVLDRQGYVLTNAHVVSGADKVSVRFEDNLSRPAELIGQDISNDLALLKVDPERLQLKPLVLGSSDSIQVGDPVLAIGNPFGLDRTLTTGVVSALQRQIKAPNGFAIENVIQTDAAINPGNSGGPLVDSSGKVIGINSQIATGGQGGGNIGIGFAVPVETAKRIIPDLKTRGKVLRPYIGITGTSIDGSLERFNLGSDKGVLVQEAPRGGPAAMAGIRGGDTQVQLEGQPLLLGGDVIISLDGKPVASMDGLVAAVNRKKPGTKLEVGFLRDGKKQSVSVTLAERPDSADGQTPE